MEIPSCLRELLQEKGVEDGVQRYFDFVSSNANVSAIRFYGKPILPPLLSESERCQMRQYRREAVKLEQRLFEACREKYSNMLLQVMEVVDRIKAKGEKGQHTDPCNHRGVLSGSSLSSMAGGQVMPKQGVDHTTGRIRDQHDNDECKSIPSEKGAVVSPLKERNRQQQGVKEPDIHLKCNLNINRNHNIYARATIEGLSQKAPSSLPPTSVNDNYHTGAANIKGIYPINREMEERLEHSDTISVDVNSTANITLRSANQNGLRNENSKIGSNIASTTSIAASGWSALSHVPSSIAISTGADESVMGDDGSRVAISTVTGDQSLMSHAATAQLEGIRGINDSLASTHLSMAFTDTSVASLQSTVEPFKSAQRQLNMDSVNNNLYQSYQHQVMPLTSTPATDYPPRLMRKAFGKASSSNVSSGKASSGNTSTSNTSSSKVSSGKASSGKASSSNTSSSNTSSNNGSSGKSSSGKASSGNTSSSNTSFSKVSSGKASSSKTVPSHQATTGQDKALEKLEMMRQKLIQEKEKQMQILRQQELARLRKKSAHSPAVTLDDSAEGAVSQQHRNLSRTASDITRMYSIAEGSFEGSLSENYPTEAESMHDKENRQNWTPSQEIHGRHSDGYPGENRHGAGYHSNSIEGHKVWENYSRALGPSSQSREAPDDKESKISSSLYIRQEFVKQIEILTSQGGPSLDSFTLLAAHAKGFLTRRLLQADKIQAVIKTIKDTRDFLADICKEGTMSLQEKSLQDRVQAQLDAARGKLHDVFFKIPVKERMAYLEHSRNLAREREVRQYEKVQEKSRRLSSATVKAMQRRQDGPQGSVDISRSASASTTRKNWDIRVLKPMQSHKSPTLPGKTRSNVSNQRFRPSTAPSARPASSRKSLGGRPSTAHDARMNNTSTANKNPSVGSVDKSQARRPVRTSREEKIPPKKPTRVSLEEKPRPQRPNITSLEEKAPPKRKRSRSLEMTEPEGEAMVPVRPAIMSMGPGRPPDMTQHSRAAGQENKTRNSTTTRKVSRTMAAKFNKK